MSAAGPARRLALVLWSTEECMWNGIFFFFFSRDVNSTEAVREMPSRGGTEKVFIVLVRTVSSGIKMCWWVWLPLTRRLNRCVKKTSHSQTGRSSNHDNVPWFLSMKTSQLQFLRFLSNCSDNRIVQQSPFRRRLSCFAPSAEWQMLHSAFV